MRKTLSEILHFLFLSFQCFSKSLSQNKLLTTEGAYMLTVIEPQQTEAIKIIKAN